MEQLFVEEDYVVVKGKRFTTFERVQFQELTVIKDLAKGSLLIEIKFLSQLELQQEKDQ